MIATAPGKLILAGEYAVLDGAEAVIAAVDRRVRARVVPAGAALGEPSAFLDAAAAQIAASCGPGSAAARAARRISVDSEPLRAGGRKLGLGSSAAATVAAVGCALAHQDPALDRDLVFRLAAAAHADAQGARGARGSGADIAASTYGGVLRFTSSRDRAAAARPATLPADLVLIPFWTGHPADTARLVAAVAAARASAPAAVGAALAGIAGAATALLAAATAAAAIEAIDAGAEALAALGRAAGLDLETPALRAVRPALARLGASAKTCGAGGGDVGIVAAPATADRNRLQAALIQAGCTPLDLTLDPRGVDIQPLAE